MPEIATVPQCASASAASDMAAVRAERTRPAAAGIRGALRERLWPVALLLFCLSLVALLTNAPGQYVRDNRFAFYWAPGHLLSRYLSIWDATRGLGTVRPDFWPSNAILYVVHEAGIPTWISQRLWHAFALTLGGVGMTALMRLFRPRIGIEHVVAALFYTFSSITVIFLLPSAIFLGYALAPWLVVVFVRGVRGHAPLRSAAVFALIVFAVGNVNFPGFPGIALAALPLIPAAAYLVVVERRVRWRRVFSWFAAAGVLSLLVGAAAIVTSFASREALSQNLAKTETFAMVSRNSSWAESWRGVGFWLAYAFRDVPQAAKYMSSPGIVLGTFIAPVVALLTLWLSRWRPRLLFASFMFLGLVVMVGAYPVDDSSPYGRLVNDVFGSAGALAALRGSFKASGALAMGLAALLGVAVAATLEVRKPLRWLAAVAAIAVIAAVAFPFWRGELYPDVRMRAVPRYWHAALEWLDHQPGEGRVLVVPSTATAFYTWGSPGDDLFEGLLDRPSVMRPQLSQTLGTAEAGDLLAALGDNMEGPNYRPGTLAPIARRLGLRYVLIRNDLDWLRTRRPNPLGFNVLRRDPDLRRVRSFGRRGQNIAPGFDRTMTARLGVLRPVEIFEIRGWVPAARAQAAAPLVVAGDGSAWPALATNRLLDGGNPVRYSADLSSAQLAAALARGGQLIVTDTNRRTRETPPFDFEPGGRSYTLARGQRLERPPDNLFSDAATETVATFRDAKQISASSYGSGFGRPEVEFRPSNAFDGDLATSWQGGTLLDDATGQWVRVEFRHPVRMSRVRIVAASAPKGDRRTSAAQLRFSDGTTVRVGLSQRDAVVRFAPRVTTFLEARVSRVRGAGIGSVGFAEIMIPGLNLREFIRAPEDWYDKAARNRQLASVLRSAPIEYVFTAQPQAGFLPAEPSLRRRFAVAARRDFALSGEMHFRRGAPEELIAALVSRWADEPQACTADVIRVDGKATPVRVLDDPGVLRLGVPVRFEACSAVTLTSGYHRLENAPNIMIRGTQLAAGDRAAPGVTPRVRTVARSRYGAELQVRADGPTAVILGQSYDPSWRASIDGRDLGAPVALDTMTGWVIRGHGTVRLTAEVGTQTAYVVALVVSGLGVLTCVFLILRPYRRRTR
jgi:arabinofuranan 3-O-arabinosyltransferase